jgi:hypothetical protein
MNRRIRSSTNHASAPNHRPGFSLGALQEFRHLFALHLSSVAGVEAQA